MDRSLKAPTTRKLAELERAVEVLRAADARVSAKGFIPHQPHPKQAEFLALTCKEALYGGAAGGGKSDALLMAALMYVHVAGYAALILRRTFRDLKQADAIMARSHEWLRGTAAKWNDRDKTWTFPSGATLTFGYCDNEKDKFQYASAAYQFIGWDELTQFPEGWYRFLFSRLRRRAGVDVPLRVRAATNPGGLGHEWVRRRFISPEPGEPIRPFVPAKLSDNPSVDAASYRTSLAELDATTRKQLEDGLWIRDSNGLVYHFDDGRNVIPMGLSSKLEIRHKILALDFGTTAPTSFNILGWQDHDPTLYVLGSWKVADLSPSECAERVRDLEKKHGFEALVGDIGGLGKGYQTEARRHYHLPIEAAEKNNKLGYIKIFNGELEHGRVKIVRETCEPLVKEWNELPWNEAQTKEAPGFDNHCADGVLYGWRRASAYLEEAIGPKKTREEVIEEHERALEESAEAELRREIDTPWWDKGA